YCVCVGRHQRIDESCEHLPQQIRGRLSKVVFKKTGRVDIVRFDGHRRWSFRGSCLRLLEGSHGDRHPSPGYRPPLISYTKLLDATLSTFPTASSTSNEWYPVLGRKRHDYR